MKLNIKKILRGLVIALAAIGAFWIGGFLWLTKGEDWEQIEFAIKSNAQLKAELQGDIVNVSPEFLGYSYGTTENSGYADFAAEIHYAKGMVRYQIDMKRTAQKWQVESAKRLN
jgi:hypothetical protein